MVFKSIYEDSIPPNEFKNSLSLHYWHQLDKFENKTLFVDYESERQWTGKEIKLKSIKIANYLINELKLVKNSNCVFFYKNSDFIHITAIGVLFSGCSICAGAFEDPKPEHKYMIELLEPKVVFSDIRLYKELLEIKEELKLDFKIVILNDNEELLLENRKLLNGNSIGLHKHILSGSGGGGENNENNLPILVDPNSPAYILLTSGSTGKPKPVARTHKNSLYVCYSLLNEKCSKDLWDLSDKSIFAGHLPLDHGTGTFSIKMTLTKGMKLIIMENYFKEMLLNAIDKFKITDCILGSALLHNLMNDLIIKNDNNKNYDLSSLRNFISVGSPIPSHELAVKFMETFKNCSVRQSLGMTECGFISFVKRSDSKIQSKTVGYLLPNIRIKLMELENNFPINNNNNNNNNRKLDDENRKEILNFDLEGELFLGGPTVSTGYIGDKFLEQQKLAFMQNGFYRTFDVCLLKSDGQLIIKGRCNDILCLGDGWKVLPAEIERALMKHPGILEAAVIGIPHPTLLTCHAPRAYIVPTNEFKNKLTEDDVCEFARNHLSEPKHLVGGVRLMEMDLPKISIGKVDKIALRKLDGY